MINWNKETLLENFQKVIGESKLESSQKLCSVCKAVDYIKSTKDFSLEGFVGIVKEYVNEQLHGSTWDVALYGSRLFFNDDTGFVIKATGVSV